MSERSKSGDVYTKRFARALGNVCKRDGRTYSEIERATCGRIQAGVFSHWLDGDVLPSPESFGELLQTFELSEIDAERLVEPWRLGKIKKGSFTAGRHGARHMSLELFKQSLAAEPLGLTQSAVARAFHVSKQRVNQIVHERHLPQRLSFRDCRTIAKAMHVTFDR